MSYKLMSKFLSSRFAKSFKDNWTNYHTILYTYSFGSMYTWYHICYKNKDSAAEIDQLMMQVDAKAKANNSMMKLIEMHFAPMYAKAKNTNSEMIPMMMQFTPVDAKAKDTK